VSLAQPLYQPVPTPVLVPTFDFFKAALFLGGAFFVYKTFFKRGRK
jgi:hypothetical protein